MAGFSPYGVPSSASQFQSQQPRYLGGGRFAGGPAAGGGNQWGVTLPRGSGGGYAPPPSQNWDYGPGENPLPGFSARQGGFEAGARTFGRNFVPGVSLGVDRPEAGSGMDTWWKKLLGGLPYVGPGVMQPLFAGNRASEALSRNEYLYPAKESMFNRGMTTMGAGLRFAPGGGATDILKNGFSGVQGARGIADFMGFNVPNVASGLGGLGAGAAWNQRPNWMGGGVPTYGGGDMGGGCAPSDNNFASSMIPSSFYQDERGGS